MSSSKELEKIKKLYGERFMKLCREYFPTILEKEGILLEVLTLTFGSNCKNLYEDIKNAEIEDKFKNLIFSKVDVENNMGIIKNKTPYELLDEAGYTLFECNSEEEIQDFRKYYADHEELCTFNGGKLNRCVVFFAVRKDAENIKRENFTNPRREDEYGTSVLGIQFDKKGSCTVSIKNRYNHTVNNPDATYGNDLERIIPGLTNSFKELLAKRNLEFNTSNIEKLEMPGYVVANDGRYYKYNMEISDRYYCPGNIVIDYGNVRKIENPEKQLLIDYFILDRENKTIELFDKDLEDGFSDVIYNMEKIDIRNDNEHRDGTKIITLTCKEKDYPIIMKIDKDNNIIYYKNENSTALLYDFLYFNKGLKELDLPNLEMAFNNALMNNEILSSFKAPNLMEVGENFLSSNKELKELDLPNLEIAGGGFLEDNEILSSFKAPNLKNAGYNFLRFNKGLKELDLLNLEIACDGFLENNEILSSFKAPNLKNAGYNFLRFNKGLKELDLPNLEIACDGFLEDNEILSSFKAPNLMEVGYNFLSSNKGLKKTLITNKEIAKLDKQNNITKSEISMAEKALRYFKSFFKKKGKEENDIEK